MESDNEKTLSNANNCNQLVGRSKCLKRLGLSNAAKQGGQADYIIGMDM